MTLSEIEHRRDCANLPQIGYNVINAMAVTSVICAKSGNSVQISGVIFLRFN